MDEWVEIKGASVEVAVQAGMAELGIEKKDHAEIEILQEPEKGFLGIGRQDAIVRVKPRPRPKRKRSGNRGGSGGGDQGSDNRASRQGGARSRSGRSRGNDRSSRSGGQSGDRNRGGGDRDRSRGHSSREEKASTPGTRNDQSRGNERTGGRSGNKRSSGSRNGRDSGRTRNDRMSDGGSRQSGGETDPVDINEQADVIEQFLSGLLDAFGLEGSIEVRVDEDVIYADINGEQAEALIGHKAAILQAIHELTKTVVQRKTMAGARLRLDIGGYRERRREALTIYAGRLAEQVIDEDSEIMLEPMSPADRKAVHDAISNIEGVRSFSEGEDPRRSVVLAPDN